MPDLIVIDDDTPNDVPFDPRYSRGAVPRDFAVDPPEMFADPSGIQLIPRSEWDARIDEQTQAESSLEHVYRRAGWKNLDQNGHGYCWMYSVTGTVMVCRSRDNQPHVRLNPHAGAAIVKRGADEGGWCGLGAKFVREVGAAVEGAGPGQWPLHSRNLKYDTPATRAEMAKHRISEDWVDLARPVYDQNLTFEQVASSLLQNNPCAVDFNWWGHSVCAVRLVRVEAGSYGLLILNSWLNWGDRGLGVLRGTKALPDGAVCTRSATVSPT
jgi:hypothetical protein